ncbi:kelch repeat-containing protein [Pseudomonas aeruginosa]|uniref:Kelch repeat-containing protein n=1 Tax=Pseudomonas aeruginosa TaxID=287 RepID=UPI0039823384
MGASITLAGESLIAQKQGKRELLSVARFVLANVPELDTAVAVDRTAGRPLAEQIVGTFDVTREGYLNPNQVVYSLLMSSAVGDFDFNWIGLETAEGVLLIVAYVPLQQKRKEIPPLQSGNNLTRNIILEYNGAQSLTGINVPAQTWQFDYTTVFAQIDTRFTELEAKVDKKLDLDNWTPPALVNLDGPELIYPGSNNNYRITDFNFASTWDVATDFGTVSRSGDTVTLAIPPNAAAGIVSLTVIRDGGKEVFKIPLGAAAIQKPSITAPIHASTGNTFEPILTSSAFQVFPAGFNSHVKTHWQIASDEGFTNLILNRESAENLRSLPLSEVPLRLAPSTRYYLRARYIGASLTSDWSSTVYFNTASVYVRKPTLTGPLDGATQVSLTGKLTADAFSVYGGADSHQASRWQISTVVDFSTVVQDSGWSTTQLTEYLAASDLNKSTQYYARVAYKGVSTGQSDWSATVGFVTGAPLVGNYLLVNSGATARQDHTMTTIGDAMYVAGGTGSTGSATIGKTLWRFDFNTQAWQQKASLPAVRMRHAACAAAGKLYLFGGSTDGGSALTADLTRYDPATDTWATLQVGPSARAFAHLVELDGYLYVLGGASGSNTSQLADCWKYSIASNTWTQIKDAPKAFGSGVSAAIAGKIYVATETFLYIYDPLKNTWTTGAAPLIAVGLSAGAAVSGLLYTACGVGQAQTGASANNSGVQEYDHVTNSWRRLPNFPVIRFQHAAAEYKGALYLFGGQTTGQQNTDTNTFYRID